MPGALLYREMIVIPTAGAGPGTEHSLLSLAPNSGVPALPGWGSTKASTNISISESQAQPSCSCLRAFGPSQSPLLSSLLSLTLLLSHSDPSPRHPHNCLPLDQKPTAPSLSIVPGHSRVWNSGHQHKLVPSLASLLFPLHPASWSVASSAAIKPIRSFPSFQHAPTGHTFLVLKILWCQVCWLTSLTSVLWRQRQGNR